MGPTEFFSDFLSTTAVDISMTRDAEEHYDRYLPVVVDKKSGGNCTQYHGSITQKTITVIV